MSERVEWIVRHPSGVEAKCDDEADARNFAAYADREWPMKTPRRAIKRTITTTEEDITDA